MVNVSVGEDGGVSVALDSPDGTFQVTTAHTNSTRDLIVGVGSHDGNPMWMVLVKETSQATGANLEGIWRLYTAESGGSPIDDTLEGESWGTWTMGPSGEVLDGSVTTSAGSVHSEALGQLDIASDGTFTGAYTYIEGMEDTIVAASINSQKTFAAGVGYHETLGARKYFLFVATLSTSTFEQADLAGTWNHTAVASNPAPAWEGCRAGTVELDSIGVVTGGSDTNCGSVAEPLSGDQLVLGADGAITGEITSTDDLSQLKHGSMTSTKNEVVLVVRRTSDESFSMIVALRR